MQIEVGRLVSDWKHTPVAPEQHKNLFPSWLLLKGVVFLTVLVSLTPSFVGAHWQGVRPFAMASSSELRSPTGPARYGSSEFATQARELIDVSANLTDEQKVIAEYWSDGPHSELPPGHWNLFAQQVVDRDRTGSS